MRSTNMKDACIRILLGPVQLWRSKNGQSLRVKCLTVYSDLKILLTGRMAQHICGLLTFLLLSSGLQAQSDRLGVDPRVELMSIIFRLAGNNEYTQAAFPLTTLPSIANLRTSAITRRSAWPANCTRVTVFPSTP